MLRLPAVAGSFYPSDAGELTAQVSEYTSRDKVAAIRGTANNLASCIDRSATAAHIATNRSKIQNLTIFPPNCIVKISARKIG